MKLKDVVDWLCASLDLTNTRRAQSNQGPCWQLMHLDGGSSLEVMHVPTGAVFRFTVEQVRPPV